MSSHHVTQNTDFSSSSSTERSGSLRLPGIFTLLDLMRQRRQLAQMDDAQLIDLGLTRTQAIAEASRPIWEVPSNWR